MRVRHRKDGTIATAVRYNPHAVSPSEIILQFDEGDMDSDYTKDWDPADPNLTHQDLLEYLASKEP